MKTLVETKALLIVAEEDKLSVATMLPDGMPPVNKKITR